MSRLEVALADVGAALDEALHRVHSLRDEEEALFGRVADLVHRARVELNRVSEEVARTPPPPATAFDSGRFFESKDRWLVEGGAVVAGIWTNDARMKGEPCLGRRRLTTRAVDALYRDALREQSRYVSAEFGVPRHEVETAVVFEAGRRYALQHSNAERTIRHIVALTEEWRRNEERLA